MQNNMEFKDFKVAVQRAPDSRVHKITGSLGSYDAYKYIRKNKWFDIGQRLTEKQFYKIIRTINDFLAQALSRGVEIKLPHRLGVLEVRKRPTRISLIDGKVVTTMPIDWDRTLKLWYEDPESYQNRTLVRIETEEVFKIYYNKNTANYNNKSFYEFKPNRDVKRRLNKYIKMGILDAFLIAKYD